MDKDSGMTKYAVLPNQGSEVEITAGKFRGQTGIVKESQAGVLKVQLRSGVEAEVQEGSCRKLGKD